MQSSHISNNRILTGALLVQGVSVVLFANKPIKQFLNKYFLSTITNF